MVAVAGTACKTLGVELAGRPDDGLKVVEQTVREVKDSGTESQRRALADGQVDQVEMRTALLDFARCLAKHDFRHVDPVVDPYGGAPRFRNFVEALAPRADFSAADRCNMQTSQPLEVVAQLGSPESMNPVVKKKAQSCLKEAGIAVNVDDNSVEDMAMTAGGKDKIVRCVEFAGQDTFPWVREEVLSGI